MTTFTSLEERLWATPLGPERHWIRMGPAGTAASSSHAAKASALSRIEVLRINMKGYQVYSALIRINASSATRMSLALTTPPLYFVAEHPENK